MTISGLLNKFNFLFPCYTMDDIKVYYKEAKNVLGVKLKSGREMMFTYDGNNYWTLETKSSYNARKGKGEKR